MSCFFFCWDAKHLKVSFVLFYFIYYPQYSNYFAKRKQLFCLNWILFDCDDGGL